MNNNNNHNNNFNFNRFPSEGKDPSMFYDFLKELDSWNAKQQSEHPWDEIAVTLGETEIKRLDLVFALLHARGTSPYYTRERWMGDVIEKALRELENYLLRVDGIDVNKIYSILQEKEEERKKHQKYWFDNRRNH